jgi:hypothetical protein
MKMCSLHPQGEDWTQHIPPDYTASHPTAIRTSFSHKHMYRWTSRCSIANIVCLLCYETHLKLSPIIKNTLHNEDAHIMWFFLSEDKTFLVPTYLFRKVYLCLQFQEMWNCILTCRFYQGTENGIMYVLYKYGVCEKLLISLHWIPFIFKWYMYSMFMSSICQNVSL